MTTRTQFVLLLALSAMVAAVAGGDAVQNASAPDAASLRNMAGRFAPIEIRAEVSGLPAGEQRALVSIVRAARIMDGLFLRQVWAGNEALLMRMVEDRTPLGEARLHYFMVNKGPWSRLDHNAPFIPGVPPKPPEANFYPAGATKVELEGWLKTLPESERVRAEGFFTTLRRSPAGKGFTIVPYSLEYQGELTLAANLLREAAAATSQTSLRRYLTTRADAFLTNDYYESDLAWMELEASIEPTIGPYEVYEDEWFNAKAAFEAFVTVRDDAETKKLERFGSELQDIEDHLPIDPQYRNQKLGALAPIRVVNEVFAAGDGNRGVQTAAFNLPNDERVVREKGSKRVMLRNVQEAKFRTVLMPISRIVLTPADQAQVTFDAFFTHILMHELMHGLGPHEIALSGRRTTVRQELKDTYSTVEEAKADISGLFALQYLIDKGVIDKTMEPAIYRTFLASAFRSIRFGVNEAHGRGIAVQLNYLLDHGAVSVNGDGTFAVNPSRIKEAVIGLTREIMTLQAHGDYARARSMLDTLGVVRPPVQNVLNRLTAVPVDIEPRFTTPGVLDWQP